MYFTIYDRIKEVSHSHDLVKKYIYNLLITQPDRLEDLRNVVKYYYPKYLDYLNKIMVLL